MTVKEFCQAHGGKPGHMIDISSDPEKLGFVSLKTVDGTAYLGFAKTQFNNGQIDTKEKVMSLLKSKELDVLEGTTESGKVCFTIVEHSDLYEAFDF